MTVGRSTTCVVRMATGKEWARGDEPDDLPMCGEPVVGERGGWPMCADHMELFDPAKVPSEN